MPTDDNLRVDLWSVIQDDDLGLLNVELVSENGEQGDSIRVRRMREIVDFVLSNSRLPAQDSTSIIEHQLAVRLGQVQQDSSLKQELRIIDTTGAVERLLDELHAPNVPESLNDELGLLGDPIAEDLATLKFVRKNHRLNPNHMERRIRCLDFYKYEDGFARIHAELSSRQRSLREFQPSELKHGDFFVLSGVLGCLIELDLKKEQREYSSGTRRRTDGRTLCVFENGTQSSMLYRSLMKALATDGYLLSEIDAETHQTGVPQSGDESMGFLYVLKTLNAKFREIPNLHKIGYTAGPVSARIANSEKQATYLFSGVKLLSAYRCYNIDSGAVENQIHDFFSSSRLDLEVRDENGQVFRPREWFVVQLDHIDRAVELLGAGRLKNYKYNVEHGCVLKAEG